MALRYAGGVLLCQVGWLGLLVLPEPGRPWVFLVMAIAEMCVPAYAEKDFVTSWHPHHVSERFGLFTIIVLGETIAASTMAVKSAVDDDGELGKLLPIAAGGLLIVFSAWWIYSWYPSTGTCGPGPRVPVGIRPLPDLRVGGRDRRRAWRSRSSRRSARHRSRRSPRVRSYCRRRCTSFTVWLLHARHFKMGITEQLVLPTTALLVILCTFLRSWAVLAAGVVAALW